MHREVGALISLQPNATKIVSQWQLDPYLEFAEPMSDRAFRIFTTEGRMVREMRLDPSTFGADRILYHRQDLHHGLRDAAVSGDGKLPGSPVEVRTASPVKSVDCDQGLVTLESGEELQGDLVIGADGIHSVVRTAVLGEERKAIPTGISAYRMLMPMENLASLTLPDKMVDRNDPSTTMIMGHEKRVIMGPGRGGKVFGIVALVPDEKMNEESTTDSWVETGDKAKLMESYADFPDWLRGIFDQAPDTALWQLRDIDPLPTWTKGRTILIGDAAHAMLPTQGQGASQSIEDAEALQAFLGDVTGKPKEEQVHAALKKVFKARYERASLIQQYSREQAKPATDGKTSRVTLDPGQFMKYNCEYSGAANWLAKMEAEATALGTR
ncbi:FAD/NAD(P)-binding domain-containing protein [Xylariaceae sp. FL0016]|nr:FAD/NAD(P)-binding domain-containing protein [Xylariaceae sp. FL0016]